MSTTGRRTLRTRVRLLAGALVLTAALPAGAAAAPAPALAAAPAPAVAPGLDPGLPRTGAPQRVVVTGPGAADAVRRSGGTLGADLPLVQGVAAEVPAAALAGLAARPGVRAVTADRQGTYEEHTYDEDTTASGFARTTGANRAWDNGHLGRGVGVAVIDTGVSPMADLAGRVVHGPDLSGEGSVVDSYGHGTVMAGIIAGSGADSAARSSGAWTGVAPAAHVVAVKAAGRNGAVDVSTMLQAMHWVSAYREQYRIRVLNLAWGVPSTQAAQLDPLNHAVQRLWAEGIVVVVAAGNSGPTAGSVTKPGDDPVVLTVGALSDQGDDDRDNDVVPGWSSRGVAGAATNPALPRKPDVVAPGRSLVSPRSYGSAVEAGNPRALVAPSYIRGSGTSQAAAVTSGVVALMLSARPDLTPDEVKQRLMATATPVAHAEPLAQGRGRISYAGAVTAPSVPAAQPRRATGLGSLEASRGGTHVVAECGGTPTEIRGEIDVRCQPWDAAAWAGSPWTGAAWTGSAWAGSAWNGIAWKGSAWADATWTGIAWKGGAWTAGSWQGSAWNGAGTGAWTGIAWKDAAWTGIAWKASAWTAGEWTGAAYDSAPSDFQSAFWGAGPPPGRYLPGERFTPRPRGRS
jgi:serine protease AprX